MKPGPLRRLAGTIGLIGLAPTAYLLATGAITRGDAAVRATATLLGVMVISRVAAWWMRSVAGHLEQEVEGDPPAPGRRRDDPNAVEGT